jgi:alpha-beta hydrolase superfamily lysophospholipase
MSTSEMTVTELSWKTPDGVRLYAVEWRPARPRAAAVLVHGLGEHCRRYDHLAEAFSTAGIALLGFDHRGHGRSEGKRGHIPSMAKAMDDINHFLTDAGERFSGLPRFLYGHSMGGLMVLNHTLTRHAEIAGVVCTSPGLSPGQPVKPFKLFLANLLYSLMPTFTLANGLDVENLSHDRKVIEAYKNDPLVTPMVSSALGLDIINTGRWVEEHGEDFALPLLLMQGLGDHVVLPAATRRFAARVPRPLITFKELPGLYHEMHNEVEKKDIFAEMIAWMEMRI